MAAAIKRPFALQVLATLGHGWQELREARVSNGTFPKFGDPNIDTNLL